jgi:hypothetical protein
MYRVFALVAFCALTGCARAQLEHQANALNHASAVSMSAQVLLNAVRASRDLPMSFTKLQSYQASNMASGNLSAKFPFGPDAPGSNELGSSLSWNPGVGTIQYVDVNTGSAIAELNKNFTTADLDRYISEGTGLLVMFTIFAKEFLIHRELANEIMKEKQVTCRSSSISVQVICRELEEIKNTCGGIWANAPHVTLEKGNEYLRVTNNAQDKCEFLNFQSLFLTFRLIGFSGGITEGAQGLRFADKRIQRKYEEIERRLARLKLKNRQAIHFTLRSPRSLLTYLGNLVALQNFTEDKFIPQILYTTEPVRKVTVFRVVEGIPAAESAALTVTDDYGRKFYVPSPNYGDRGRDQTLRVLTITAEMVNAAISEKTFPVPSTIVVRPIN